MLKIPIAFLSWSLPMEMPKWATADPVFVIGSSYSLGAGAVLRPDPEATSSSSVSDPAIGITATVVIPVVHDRHRVTTRPFLPFQHAGVTWHSLRLRVQAGEPDCATCPARS